MDVVDLHYSLPHDGLLNRVKERIAEHGQKSVLIVTGVVPTGASLEIISTYLNSTLVGYGKGVFLQKTAICIGWNAARILSDLYLSMLDNRLKQALGDYVSTVFRYADDYLFWSKGDFKPVVFIVSEKFRVNGDGFIFTKKKLIQFTRHLVHSSMVTDHVCWQYSHGASKPLLNFHPKHPKVVENGIANVRSEVISNQIQGGLKTSLTKPCVHQMNACFNARAKCLLETSYPIA